MDKIKKGQRITVSYEEREFEVIVIDPNGLGKDQPSLGFGFNMMEKYGGIKQQTLSDWVTKESRFEGDRNKEINILKPPSGNSYKVTEIIGDDKNIYQVIEISDWVTVAGDVLKKPGKIRKGTKDALIDFLTWFATKGLYAEAYVALKGLYTAKDSRSLSSWMMARLEGKIRRNKYTDFLQAQGCEGYDYGNWTNYIYEGLFGKTATEMKQLWSVVEGTKTIARNYISEDDGLKAVAHCENLTVELFVDELKEAHDDAISNTIRKFASTLKKLNSQS